MRERFHKVDDGERKRLRRMYALGWGLAQLAVMNVVALFMGLVPAVLRGEDSALAMWLGGSAVLFVLGYLWCLVIADGERARKRPA